jgi:hypothetical protein
MRRDQSPPIVPTLEGSGIAIDSISIIFELEKALNPFTPDHQPIAVQSMAGPIVRVAAGELKRVFGSRRRPGTPLPIGGVRPGRNAK